jgi:GNAT superfamily N-acetyltransferase
MPVIERATIDDLPKLLPLVAAYRRFYRQESDPGAERDFVARRLADGSSIAFVAFAEGRRAIGFVQMFPTYSTVRLGPALILEDLFVEPSARGAGAGALLLERAITHAREIGATGMFLETAIDNASAQRLYERAGWLRENRFYKYNAPLD